jgi:hypothetical protein
MELFLVTLLAALLIALAFKGLRRVTLKALGWNDRPLVLEVRVGAILFLVCANVIAAIAYWFPWYLSRYHAAPDDRYGFAVVYAFPFWFLGAGISAWALFRLIEAVFRAERSSSNFLYGIVGCLLALGGFSPLFMVGWRIVKLRQGESLPYATMLALRRLT